MTLGRAAVATAAIGAALLALAACGGTDATVEPTATEEAQAAPTSPAATATAPAATEDAAVGDAEPTTIAVAESALGEVLVDADGIALYRFDQDSPGQSTCSGDCAAAWPPLTGEASAGEGVAGDLLGSIEREDGTVQVTYDGWPLYYFAEDAAPGDTSGQGVNDVWWLVAPGGERVTGTAESAPAGRDY